MTETVPSIAYISLSTLTGPKHAQKIIANASAYVNKVSAPYKATLLKQIEFLKKFPETISAMELIGIDGYFATSGAPVAGKNYFTLLAAQQHLLSRGTIHINSSDPTAYPIINANYYDAPFDLTVASAGTKYLRKVAAAPQYASYIASEVVPGAGADLEAYTKTTGFTTEYHPIGTAR